MKKLLLALITCLSLQASSVVEYSVKDNINKLDLDLKDGTSGVVVHDYGFEKSTIVAKAIVVNSGGNKNIKYEKYDDLLQDNIPSFKDVVKSGDKILFNYLYDEAVLIAPNSKTYNDIVNIRIDKNFKSSDLLAGFLSMENTAKPQKEELQKFAKTFQVGLIYIAVDNYIYEVDVNSFKILSKMSFLFFDKSTQKPFFSNVESISKNILSFDNEVDDYNEHYKELLGL
jgi:hypothetical protein